MGYQHNENQHERDEIDLVDIWLMVAKRRIAFISCLLIAVVLGISGYFLLPKQYEYKLLLEIGGVWSGSANTHGASIGRFEALESPNAVKVKIERSYAGLVVDAYQEQTDGDVPNDVVVSVPGDTEMLQIEITEPISAEPAVTAILQGIADRVLASHNELLGQRVRVLKDIASEQIAEIDERIEELQASRRDVVENGSVESKGISLLMVDTKIQELRAERMVLERELEVSLQLNTRPTRIIAGPVHARQPAGPGLVLTLALSILVGVVVGFGLVVILNVKELAQSRANSSSRP